MSFISITNNYSMQGLSTNVFRIDAAMAVIANRYSYDFADAALKVYQIANRDKSIWNVIPFFESYGYWDVVDVMTSYQNLCLAQIITEYTTGDQNVIKSVANSSGRTPEAVTYILEALQYLTLDNQISSSEFLRPLTWKTNEEIREVQPKSNKGSIAQGMDDLADTVTSIASIAKWGLLAAVLGWGGWNLYKLYKDA